MTYPIRMKILKATAFVLAFVAPLWLHAQDLRYDAWYVSLLKEYTLHPDGSIGYRYAKEQKLLTYRAFHNLYGETFVVFDPALQKLKINKVATVMADGRKVEAPENAFNEVLPGYAANAPAYNGLREMVITHTGLERNATVLLDYEVLTSAGVLPILSGNELLAENEPVKSLEIRIRVPEGRNLVYKVLNSKAEPVVTTEGRFRVYSWKMSDLPALSVEENQPGGQAAYPRLLFSTSGEREEVFSSLTGQPSFRFEISEQMQKAVNRITEEKKDKFAVALALQEEVVNDLKLFSIPFRTAFYRCRTGADSWNSNGGTPVEKAVVLASMMKAAGIDAHVAGICRTAFDDPKIGTLSEIEDFAVVATTRERGDWFFSVTGLNAVNLETALPGRTFLIFRPGEKTREVKSGDPAFNIKVRGNFILSSDPAITGELSVYYDGAAYPFAAQQRDKSRMRTSMTGGLVGPDSANLKTSTLNTGNGYQVFTAKKDKPFRKDSSNYFFSLPVSTQGVESWGIRTLSVKRESSVEVPALADESYTYTFTLPSGFALFTPEAEISLSNGAGTFVWEVSLEKGQLTVRKQIKLTARVFTGPLYDDFKALMDAWNNPWQRQVVFTAAGS